MSVDTIQQEMFILYPYYGPAILVMNVHLVLDSSPPFRAITHDVKNNEIKSV